MRGMRHIHKHTVFVVVLCGLLVAAAILPIRVFASTSSTCSPIISGLWKGVSLATGTTYDCQGNVVSMPVTEQEQDNSFSTGSVAASPPSNSSNFNASINAGEYVALGDSVADARAAAYEAASRIHFDGVRFRRDIASA